MYVRNKLNCYYYIFLPNVGNVGWDVILGTGVEVVLSPRVGCVETLKNICILDICLLVQYWLFYIEWACAILYLHNLIVL